MNNLSKDEYNKEPVFYCRHCLTLNVRHIHTIANSEYCDECGSTDIGECTITEWENLYSDKFGHKFLDEY